MGADELAIRLMERERVVVHPGHFYGFDGDGRIVLSLLPPRVEFAEGITRLLRSIAG
jgi:aspartate/methionine/tyrosine aminotransferase